MTAPMQMTGHQRTYQPPRALRRAAAEVDCPDDLDRRIAAGRCEAWDLFVLEQRTGTASWAGATLDSLLAAVETDAEQTLGCTDCADIGFYGVPDEDNPDLLTALVRREGTGTYQALTATGAWEDWTPPATDAALEILDLDLAGDLAGALTSDAGGLLRRYTTPRMFLPPQAVVAAASSTDLLSREDALTPHGEWVNFAVVDEFDPGAVLELIRVRMPEGPEAEPEIQFHDGTDWQDDDPLRLEDGVPLVPLTAAMAAMVADAPLTVSPDPRAEKLRRYWSSGKGAAKIKWGLPSDWRRCYRHLRKYMGTRAKGYCFTGDTEFVTREGLMTFADARDTLQFVLTQAKPRYGTYSTPTRADGYWVQAPIRSFGEQSVLRLTVKRGGITKVIRATPEHRWMASPNGRNVRRFDVRQFTTAELRPGMVLTGLTAAHPGMHLALPPEAVAAGAVYGDGHKSSPNRSRIDLWGKKQDLLPYFEPYATSVSPLKLTSGVLGLRAYGLPGRWKNSPDMTWSDQELLGWLAGYIATDGAVNKRGAITLSSSSMESLHLVRSVCARLGIVASGVQTQMRKGYLTEEGPLYRTTLYRHSVPDNLLIRKDQRAAAGGPARENLRWTVVSVEDHGEREEVFCVTVPETESFALADDIWSLNCQNLHKRNTGVWTGDKRNVGGNGRRGGLLASGEDTSAEESLYASILSGHWTGNQEGIPTVTVTEMNAPVEFKDGVYSEVDQANAGIMQTLVAGGFPVAPPKEWFANPKLDRLTPITITDDGRVYGHMAPTNIAHIGLPGNRRAPRSASGYAYFMTGAIKTAEGDTIPCGQLTVAGGHASTERGVSVQAAVQHYDDTGSAGADVAMGDDEHGIWVAGALRPDVTPEKVRVMRASPLSGDWRTVGGNLEVVAACHVNVPGFPIPQVCVASGAIVSMVAAGVPEMMEIRRHNDVFAEFADRLKSVEDQIAAFTAATTQAAETPAPVPAEEPVPDPEEQVPDTAEGVQEAPQEEGAADASVADDARAKMMGLRKDELRAKVAVVAAFTPPSERKGGGFPIGGVASLKKAILAYGRSRPEDRAKTRAHIISMAKKLGRTDLIPANWK